MDGMDSSAVTMMIGMAVSIVIFMVGFLLRRNDKKRIQACTAQTDGTVSEMVRSISTDSDDNGKTRRSYVYYPVFTYTADGREITKTSRSGTGTQRFQKGQAVTVRYNPDDVEQYYVVEDKAAARISIYFMGFGILIFALLILMPFLH
ncbi:DUF3592 domain-containing protein [Caproiciproducens sp.]